MSENKNTQTQISKQIQINKYCLDILLNGGLELPKNTLEKSPDSKGIIILIKGRPGVGKSTIALQIVYAIAKHIIEKPEFHGKYGPYYFNIETEYYDILDKLLNMKLNQIFHELMKDKEFYKIAREKERAGLINNFIDDFSKVLSDVIKKNAETTQEISNKLDSFFEQKLNVLDKSKSEILENFKKEFMKLINELINIIEKIEFNFLNKTIDNENSEILKSRKLQQLLYELYDLCVESVDRNDNGGLKYSLIAIDGINIISKHDKNKIHLSNLLNSMRSNCYISLIVLEPEKEDIGFIDYMADIVIEMKGSSKEIPLEYYINEICVVKSKHQKSIPGWHEYQIKDIGIVLNKSIKHYLTNISDYDTKQINDACISMEEKDQQEKETPSDDEKDQQEKETPSDDEKNLSILESMIGGKIAQGNSTVLLGPRACFKTELTIDYLFTGSKRNGKGLILSLMGNARQIGHLVNYCPRKNDDENCCKCLENNYFYYQIPGEITPASFFFNIDAILNRITDIKRVLFWDLTQLEFRFPLLVKHPTFLATLMKYFKEKKISVLFMGSGNSIPSKPAAAMADNVIYNWRDEIVPYEAANAIYKKTFNLDQSIRKDEYETIFGKKGSDGSELKANDKVISFYIERKETQVTTNNYDQESIFFVKLNDKSKLDISNCTQKLSLNKPLAAYYFKNASQMIEDITKIQGMQP